MIKKLSIGTRGSPLALQQANDVKEKLLSAHGGLSADDIKIVVIKTTGDMVQDRPLMEIGGKGLFTKEIEDQLLSGDIDIAVHSSKDMPTQLPKGLVLSHFLERVDPRDAFIAKNAKTLFDLPEGARLGTASLRRKAQALHLRPDLNIVSLRGNVDTRIKKIAEGEVDATFLAMSGIERLEKADDVSSIMDLDNMLPAPAQGAVGLEIKEGNEEIKALLDAINHLETEISVRAERAFLKVLDGNCRTPIAALAGFDEDILCLEGKVFSLDGQTVFEAGLEGDKSDPEALGEAVGKIILESAGQEFFDNLKLEMEKG